MCVNVDDLMRLIKFIVQDTGNTKYKVLTQILFTTTLTIPSRGYVFFWNDPSVNVLTCDYSKYNSHETKFFRKKLCYDDSQKRQHSSSKSTSMPINTTLTESEKNSHVLFVMARCTELMNVPERLWLKRVLVELVKQFNAKLSDNAEIWLPSARLFRC